jgi:transposase-like protein
MSAILTHRRRLNSTNMIERVMKEIKRRTRVVGVFPNEASCDRLVGALLVEMDEEWRVEEECYLNMERIGEEIGALLVREASPAAA